MKEETEVRFCIDCSERPAYVRSSYCGKCLYIRKSKSIENTQKARDRRITAEVTINGLSAEIEDLINQLANGTEGVERLFLKNRLSTQTKNLSYLALGFVRNG